MLLRGYRLFGVALHREPKGTKRPGIHYLDAHRLRAHLLQAQELQLHPRASNLAGPEGAGDTVEDPSSDEERDTTDAETDAETAAEEAWCPPMPDAPDDPTESEIAGAADKLETMLRGSHPSVNIFFQLDKLGVLPALWLQAKLTISSTSIQDKFAKFVCDYCSRTVVTRANRHPGDCVSGCGQKLHYPASRSISEISMLANEAC